MRKSNRSKRYTEESKPDAAQLAPTSDKTVTQVARDLGVSAKDLQGWMKQAEADRGQGRPDGLTPAEREELPTRHRRSTCLGLTPVLRGEGLSASSAGITCRGTAAGLLHPS